MVISTEKRIVYFRRKPNTLGNLLLPNIGKIPTIPPYNPGEFYVLTSAAMNHYFCIFVAAFCLLLIPLGTCQEPIYVLSDEQAWGNPYPGLGNVSPGSASTAPPSTFTFYDDRLGPESQSELSPTTQSTELYLSRFPQKRTGMFQKANFNVLWAPDTGGSKGLGITELDLSAMFALPLPTPDAPLLITPKFTTTFFDSNHKSLNWHKTFYTTGLSLRWIRPIVKDKLTADLGFSAFYSGDFNAKGRDTLRFPVHLAGIWNFNPRTKFIFGVVYADRKDSFNVFPMAGLIWAPHDDLSVELIVPRLRVAQRIRWFGSGAGDEQSDWLYTAFEFGSGSWGCDFWGWDDGRVEYRDLRLLLGYERRTRFGATLGLEVGYMFDRNFAVYDSWGHGSVRPSDSVFLRLRTSF